MDSKRLLVSIIFFFSLFMLLRSWEVGQISDQQPSQETKLSQGSSLDALESDPIIPKLTQNLSQDASIPEVKQSNASELSTETLSNKTYSVDTDLYFANFSENSGSLVGLTLKHYHDGEDKTQLFQLMGSAHSYSAESGFIGDPKESLPNHQSTWERVDHFDKNKVIFQFETESFFIEKEYTLKENSYLIDLTYRLTNKTDNTIKASTYYQFVRDNEKPSGSSGMVFTFTGPAFYSEEEKYQKVDFDDVGDGGHIKKADNGWAGMVQHYFVSAWVPSASMQREFFTNKITSNLYSVGLILPFPDVAPASTQSLTMPFYSGPQEQKILKTISPGLVHVVDYGLLTIIASPLFSILTFLEGLSGNWGWAIVLLTLMIKILFFPLSAASYKSMAKMRLLGPKLKKIKELYGSDRQKLNQEMIALYRKEKVNPVGGCLPVLVQIPVFLALYWVLLGSVEMREAPWILWITDLSQKDPLFILPIVMGLTMLIQTRLNPTPPDPIQAKVMLILPVVFTAMFLMFPSGLVLYWTVNNILSIAQQWQINKMIDKAGLKK